MTIVRNTCKRIMIDIGFQIDIGQFAALKEELGLIVDGISQWRP